MKIDPQTAAGSFLFGGATYYFCNPRCKKSFEKEPQKYLSTEARQ
jgi:Cu+-exporting ATPase